MTPKEIKEKRTQLEAEKKKLQGEIDGWDRCCQTSVDEVHESAESKGPAFSVSGTVRSVEKHYERLKRPLEERIAEIDKELADLPVS